jgi:hypothetical protein
MGTARLLATTGTIAIITDAPLAADLPATNAGTKEGEEWRGLAPP